MFDIDGDTGTKPQSSKDGTLEKESIMENDRSLDNVTEDTESLSSSSETSDAGASIDGIDGADKSASGLTLRCDRKALGIESLEFAGGPFLDKNSLIQKLNVIKSLANATYAEQVLKPVDDIKRPSALSLIYKIADRVLKEEQLGPLCLLNIELSNEQSEDYEVAVVLQNRSVRNGVWSPKHHNRVNTWLSEISAKRLPVVTFIDTPGADAGNQANMEFQAGSISELIAGFTRLDVPSIGVIYGKGYSGGAIPLAATNLLFALKDAVFSTIQPQGLAAIARKENLTWQECAQKVGINAVELVFDGVIDGVIDYSPLEETSSANADKANASKVKDALLAGLTSLIEQQESTSQIRDLRWQTLRSRLSFQEPHYEQGEASERIHIQIQPRDASKRVDQALSQDNQNSDLFEQWLTRSQPLRYHKVLDRLWSKVQADTLVSSEQSGRIGQSIDDQQFQKIEALSLSLAIEFFHQWQGQLSCYLDQYKRYLDQAASQTLFEFMADRQAESGKASSLSLTDFVSVREIQELVLHHLELLKLLDVSYNKFLSEICSVAWEYSLKQTLSVETVQKLLRSAQIIAAEQGIDRERAQRFLNWLHHLEEQDLLKNLVTRMNDWKQRQFPQTDAVLFVVSGYFISTLLTRLYWHQVRGIPFSGAFQPRHIGRQKNFWHRLTQASRNVRIQQVLNETKAQRLISPQAWIDLMFESFQPLDQALVTKDPKVFPGFAKRINQALDNSGTPCGLLTGVGALKSQTKSPNAKSQVGLFVSNSDFQAGAFDMASAEKLCRLLERASVAGIPVIGLVSSAGMQTKEGASALFSMAVVNEAISRFTDAGGRMMIIGYGDCTGGAQASFVTHPNVDTYYLSGTNLPFAGQVVVPEHLTLQATLSNYLTERRWGDKNRQVMKGLIRHPFFAGLDRRLKEIDPSLTLCELSLNEVLETWLSKNGRLNNSSDAPVKHKQYNKIKQLLIHARGCTALRLIEAAHTADKQVVLVQSDPDMNSVAADALGIGDRLVCLGGQSSEESYLSAHSVLRVAELEQVDALHPGIGFLSENADFAAACLEKDLNFIGPEASSIARMGDKAQAIATAKAAHVPTVPGSNGVVASLTEARQVMADIGVPLLIKASHGGGGKGIGTVQSPEELEATFLRVQQEAKSAFGCGDVYIERLLESVRHIEVQVLRDSLGNFRMMGVRDCSAQRNRQKIIEESGEYVLTQDQIFALNTWSAGLSHRINYVGAGTVEFLYDLERECFYFMEMNTRLQVEHIVTEMTSGVDLVQQQFRIAEGHSIAELPEEVVQQGHAIEVRVNAESISKDSNSGELVVTPATGRFTQVDIPEKDYVRVLSVAAKGKEMTPFYDNLVAQVVVHGKDRAEAIARLRDYLDELVIAGVDTNLPLIKALLKSGEFTSGKITTAFVEEWVAAQGDSLDALVNPTNHTSTASNQLIELDGNECLLKLPNTGVVYAAPSPESAPFVKPGDVVSGNQTLLLLEVMKMFMPITLNHFFKNASSKDKYRVMHCRDVDGQYLQQGEVVLTLKQI